MIRKFKSHLTVLLTTITISGCATFEPGLRIQDLHRPRQPTAKLIQEGLEISVEEFVSPAKAQMIFDTDLASSGVLALLMRVENGGIERFVARRDGIKAFVNGQPLVPLSPREAATMAATSEYVGKALGWTVAAGPFAIVLWPFTIGASAVHTHGVNKRIEQYFDVTSYQDALLSPKQTTLGFVYFKLPDGEKRLENFTVETEAASDATGKKLAYKFELPTMQLAQY